MNEPKPDTRIRRIFKSVFEVVKTFCLYSLIFMVINRFAVQVNGVSGPSMQPTLYTGDRVLVERLTQLFGEDMDYRDIVTIRASELKASIGNIVKRVVGKPGDHIQIIEGSVFRNGEKIEEPYLAPDVHTYPRNEGYDNVYLGQDEYYVLGDNREHSLDSRDLGPIHKHQLIGKLIFRFYPFHSFGSVH